MGKFPPMEQIITSFGVKHYFFFKYGENAGWGVSPLTMRNYLACLIAIQSGVRVSVCECGTFLKRWLDSSQTLVCCTSRLYLQTIFSFS
jgi:hypothetical protein